MKAVSRVGKTLLGAALALAPAFAAAQQTTPTTNTTSPDTIGPRELRNFSLPGTVTRPADQPARTATTPSQPATTAPATTDTPPAAPERARERAPASSREAAPAERAPREPARTTAPAPTTTTPSITPAPSLSAPVDTSSVPEPSSQTSFPPAPETTTAAPERSGVPLYVWLIAALVLGAGGAFLFRRSREREAFAGGPQIDEYVAPEPEPPVTRTPAPRPAPAPAPVAEPAPPAKPTGIVSTRLRPWLEIGFSPTRCVLNDQHASIDFVIELFNSGSIPARDVVVGATAFNAGPLQDQLIANFFEQANEQGQRVEVIPPLQPVSLELQINIPRDQLQPYELGGQQVFVPLIAFNASYRWSSGAGQTSASYLLGRATQSDKLAPFRLEAAPRIFRGLAAKALPTGLRR